MDNLFKQDPLELVKDAAALRTLVAYLRAQRENFEAIRASGKRVSKKALTSEPITKEVRDNILEQFLDGGKE